ncbi:hypothetical protein ACFLT1_07955 [Bacteroidota bacterium]
MAGKKSTSKTERPPEFSKNRQLEWKRKILVFSFFLAISIGIWLLNALSKNYTTEIKYPISYSRLPEKKLLVSDVPEYFSLKVNAHGYALLSYKLSRRPVPINFAVGSYAMNRISGDSTKLFLLTRYAREQVARQLPSELQLLEISPDSLIFQFADEVDRYLPVIPKLNYEIGKDFTLIKDLQVSPESIQITGPNIFLDTMRALSTEFKNLGLLEKSYSGRLKVTNYEKLKSQENEVEVQIELEKLTEVQVTVPIQISGLPDSLRMQVFPQKISIRGNVGLSKYDRIVPEAFFVEVDYQDVLDNKTRLPITLLRQPDVLLNSTFSPKTVEFLLSVK